MNKYTKQIDISFTVDDRKIKSINETINKLRNSADFDIGKINTDDINNLRSMFDKMSEHTTSYSKYYSEELIEQLREYEAAVSKLKELKEDLARIDRLEGEEAEFARQGLEGYIKAQEEYIDSLERHDELDPWRKQIAEIDKIQDDIKETAYLIERLSKMKDPAAKAEAEELKKQLEELQAQLNERVETDTSTVQSGGGSNGDSTNALVSAFGKKAVALWFLNKLSEIAQSAIKALAETFKNAWAEMDEVLQSSYLSNSETRELMFSYGFSQAEAYGYSQAMDFMGLSSMDDLYYLTSEQWTQFNKIMSSFTERYNELYDSGMLREMQEMEWEIKEFQQEMQWQLIEFIIDNKDTIKSFFEIAMEAGEVIITVLGWIFDTFGDTGRTDSERTAATREIISSYSTTTSGDTNVKIDNTFNNVNSQDQNWLANAGQLTYEQVIKALT